MTDINVDKSDIKTVMRLFVAALLALLTAAATANVILQPDWVSPSPGGILTVPPVAIGAAINDFTGNFTPAEREQLGQKLVNSYRRNGLMIVLIHVASTGAEPINDYARRVFDSWSNGLLNRRSLVFVVAFDDNRWWISTGYDVEGFLPDLEVSRISSEIFEPTLKTHGYYAAVDATLDALIAAADKEVRKPTLHFLFPPHIWAIFFILWWGLLFGAYRAWRYWRRPQTGVAIAVTQPSYAGFWVRFQASAIDGVLYLLVAAPVLALTYNNAYFLLGSLPFGNTIQLMTLYLFPLIASIGFWLYRAATPGKAAFAARIVDVATGRRPSPMKLVVRGFAYLLSALPLGLGFLWIIWDRRKQAWHDKLAGTVVVGMRRPTMHERD